MVAASLFLIVAALLTDFGWQTTPGGEVEFVIQIEPELLDELRQGKEIVSEIPDDLQHVRRFRIRVGDSPVPREKLPPRADADETQRSALSISDDPQNEPSSNTQINEPPQLLPSRGGAFVPAEESPSLEPNLAAPAAFVLPQPGAKEPVGQIPNRAGSSEKEQKDQTALQPIPKSPASVTQFGNESEKAVARIDHNVRTASASEPVGGSAKPSATSAKPSNPRPSGSSDTRRNTTPSTPEPMSRPWVPFVLTSLALFASIGLNGYLGWITLGALRRYRDLAQQIAAE